jgi:hypothetical protein
MNIATSLAVTIQKARHEFHQLTRINRYDPLTEALRIDSPFSEQSGNCLALLFLSKIGVNS